MVINAFTVDVEDYFQVSGFESHICRSSWQSMESRIVRNTARILELLERCNVRGTFFVLGWIARQFPQLVTEIDAAGHEIGSHSFEHRLVYRQTADEFRQDLRQSRDVLQDLVGKPVTLYRAPSFSITRQALYAWDVLAEEGFVGSSSVLPARHDRAGIPDASPQIHAWRTPAGTVWEFPPTVMPLGPLRVPVGGGGYFRLYPWWLSRWALSRVQSRTVHPINFYIHPWEVDPGQPRLGAGTRSARFRHYLNLTRTEQRLQTLLSTFRFAPMGDVLRRYLGQTREILGAPPLSSAGTSAGTL